MNKQIENVLVKMTKEYGRECCIRQRAAEPV